jgi:SAM-dependent methyltransferase
MFYIRDVMKHSVFDKIDKETVFEQDNIYYNKIRDNINSFISETINAHKNKNILEVGPKNNKNERLKVDSTVIETVDIIDDNDTTYVADLSRDNCLPKEYYDAIYCLEVLEHTYEPKKILEQIYKLLKKNGHLYLSVPFQFRIHGPLPDNYRFSEFGLKYLLEKCGFSIILFKALIDSERPAFPIHYTVKCIKL